MLLAYAFALENRNVTAEAIEAQEFMDLARAHRVMGVPRTVVNGKEPVDGAMPETAFLESVLAAATPDTEGHP